MFAVAVMGSGTGETGGVTVWREGKNECRRLFWRFLLSDGSQDCVPGERSVAGGRSQECGNSRGVGGGGGVSRLDFDMQ